VTLTFRGFKKILNPWWLNRRGKIIGGWVEVDRWLQNFCSRIALSLACTEARPSDTPGTAKQRWLWGAGLRVRMRWE